MSIDGNYCRRLGIPLKVASRLTRLIILFTPTLTVAAIVLLIFKRPKSAYSMITWSLRQAGATFIKLGQWASTRPDILPRDLCQSLAELHSDAPAHRMSWNRHMVKREFGVSLEELFSEFSSNPIGSGTIGQVHRARLRKTDAEVVVKIMHPRVEEYIERDLWLMRGVAEAINILPGMSWFSLPEEVAYFAHIMKSQCDFRAEALSLGHFARNFSTWPSVYIPQPIYPLISKHILTESYAEGVPIMEVAQMKPNQTGLRTEWNRIKESIALTGFQAFLQMLLWDNFVHADLHPGNILIRFLDPNTKRPVLNANVDDIINHRLRPQVVFIDTGLVTTLSRRDYDNFTDLFMALVLRADGHEVAKMIIDRGPPSARLLVIDEEGFGRAMDDLVKPLFSLLPLELGRFSISPILFKVFDMVRAHHVRLEPAFTNLVMSFVCVEGLGRQLAPDLNLLPLLARSALQYLVTRVGPTTLTGSTHHHLKRDDDGR